MTKNNIKCDPEDIKDAERFRWLMNRGFAWRGCYDEVSDWKEGEWLYYIQGARQQIDESMNMKKKEIIKGV